MSPVMSSASGAGPEACSWLELHEAIRRLERLERPTRAERGRLEACRSEWQRRLAVWRRGDGERSRAGLVARSVATGRDGSAAPSLPVSRPRPRLHFDVAAWSDPGVCYRELRRLEDVARRLHGRRLAVAARGGPMPPPSEFEGRLAVAIDELERAHSRMARRLR